MATTAEYGLGDYTYPRGWFMVAEAIEVADKPIAVRFFGEDLVLYRGESGAVYMVDAYCPHMGTHLAKNTTSYVVLDGDHIEGESIRCPYHAWKFGPDGKCNEIPYSPQPIPDAAKLRTWRVEQRAGIIFAWYDPEGGMPEYELPEFPEWDDAQWVNWKIDHLGVLECHPQEIVDNMVDKAHLTPIHGSKDMEYFENEFDKHVIFQKLAAGHKTLSEDILTNHTWYTGPAILQSRMVGDFPSLMIVCHTPIDDGVVKLWHGLLVKASSDNPSEEEVAAARQFQEASRLALSQDIEVWAHKRPCFGPMQVRGDGPFGKLRIWYKQFYNPRERAHEFHSRVDGEYLSQGTKKNPWPDVA